MQGYISSSELSSKIGNANLRNHASKLNIIPDKLDVGMAKRKPLHYKLDDATRILESFMEYKYRYNSSREAYLSSVLKELQNARDKG